MRNIFRTISKKIHRAFSRISKHAVSSNLYKEYYLDGIIYPKVAFFESFSGASFQGDPYYIFKWMLGNSVYSNWNFYISVENTSLCKLCLKRCQLYKSNVHIVLRGSKRAINALCHASIIVNNVGFTDEFIKKKNQIYINTWHGTGPKYCGKNYESNSKAFYLPQHNFMIADYILCPNNHIQRMIENDHMLVGITRDKLLYVGSPRNSVFFQNQSNVSIGKKVVCFMPTWRGVNRFKYDLEAFKKIDQLAADFSDQYEFICKLHPNMLNVPVTFDNCKNVTGAKEIYEILNTVDYLITDWSSVLTDFANKSQNIILFQYDKEYMLDDRGLYLDFIDSTPFPIANDISSLKNLLQQPILIDGYEEFIKRYCSREGFDVIDKLFGMINMHHDNPNIFDIIFLDKKIDIELLRSISTEYNKIYIVPYDVDESLLKYYNQFDDIQYLLTKIDSYVELSGSFFKASAQEKHNAEIDFHKAFGYLSVNQIIIVNTHYVPRMFLSHLDGISFKDLK